MLTVTDAAASQFAEILNDDQVEDDKVVRLVAKEGQLSLALDTQRPEDTTFEHDEKTVLAVDNEIAQLVDEKTLDVDESSNLVLR